LSVNGLCGGVIICSFPAQRDKLCFTKKEPSLRRARPIWRPENEVQPSDGMNLIEEWDSRFPDCRQAGSGMTVRPKHLGTASFVSGGFMKMCC